MLYIHTATRYLVLPVAGLGLLGVGLVVQVVEPAWVGDASLGYALTAGGAALAAVGT